MREITPEYVQHGHTYLTASNSQLLYFCYFFQLEGGMAKKMASLQAFPSSLASGYNCLTLPFRIPATQPSSVSDYKLITCLLRTSLLRTGSGYVELIFPLSPARLQWGLCSGETEERLRIAFTANGKREIQVEAFSKRKRNKQKQLKTILMDRIAWTYLLSCSYGEQ